MASEGKATLASIPNSVSGDGTVFANGVKRYLRAYDAEENGEKTSSQIRGLRLFHQIQNGKQNIVVYFNPDGVANYDHAEIWHKSDTNNVWVKAGTGQSGFVITDVEYGIHTVKVLSVDKKGNTSALTSAISATIQIVGDNRICNTPVQFFWDGSQGKWIWDGYIDNGYTDYFEIRLDQNPGASSGRIDTVPFSLNTFYSLTPPDIPMGTAYLYVRNNFGEYNNPVAHTFNINGFRKPLPAVIGRNNKGIEITLEVLPNGATSYVIDVDGEEYETASDKWTFYQFDGEINVRYCFAGPSGRGEWSDYTNYIAGDYVASESVQPLSITAGKIAANAVTTDKLDAYAVTADKINAGAVTADKVAANAITTEKLAAEAVTADTIAANAIHASHLYGETIELADKLEIQGGAAKINEKGMTLTGGDGSTTSFNEEGIVYKDVNGVTYAQVKKMIIGQAYDGMYIRFNAPWAKPPTVFCSISNMQVSSVLSSSNLFTVCEASEITVNGFRVNCYVTTDNGRQGMATPNYSEQFPGFTAFTENTDSYAQLKTATAVFSTPQYHLPDAGGQANLNVRINVNISGVMRASEGHYTDDSYEKIEGADHSSIVAEVMSNGTVKATQTFRPAMGNLVKSFTMNAVLPANTAFTVRFTITKSAFDYPEEAVNRDEQGHSTRHWTIADVNRYLKSAYDLTFEIPTYSFNSTAPIKVNTGYANFIATDGGTNAYKIE